MATKITRVSDEQTLTPATFEAEDISTIDIRDEIAKVFAAGGEAEVRTAKIEYDGGQSGRVVYFPNAGRGAVATGGDSVWMDCNGIDDLIEEYNAIQAED